MARSALERERARMIELHALYRRVAKMVLRPKFDLSTPDRTLQVKEALIDDLAQHLARATDDWLDAITAHLQLKIEARTDEKLPLP
jgi:hypothetical protein